MLPSPSFPAPTTFVPPAKPDPAVPFDSYYDDLFFVDVDAPLGANGASDPAKIRARAAARRTALFNDFKRYAHVNHTTTAPRPALSSSSSFSCVHPSSSTFISPTEP